MEIVQKVNLHNRFDIEVIDGKSGHVRQKAFAENIILNQLWTKILSGAYFTNIHFGSGTGTLSASRTSLFANIGSKAATGVEYAINSSDGWMSIRRSIQLQETEYVGSILQEVGIAYGSSSTTLVTHAFLKDMNGNQVVITKTNVDIITIYATVYIRFPASGWLSGKIRLVPTLTPNDYGALSTTFRWLFGLNEPYSGPYTRFHFLGANPLSMVCSNAVASEIKAASKNSPTKAIDDANKKITFSTRVSAIEGNDCLVKGFWSVAFGMGSDVYPPSSEDIASIWFDLRDSAFFVGSTNTGELLANGDGIVKDFKTAFPFPRSGAVVNVDGCPVTDVIIDSAKPPSTNIGRHINVVDRSSVGVSGYGPSLNHSELGGTGSWLILENPYYSDYGLDNLYVIFYSIYTSDNGADWTLIRPGSSTGATFTIPVAHRGKRYWKFISTTESTYQTAQIHTLCAYGLTDLNNVHLTTPPGLVLAESVGMGNGSQTEFPLTHTPISGSLVVKLDGNTTSDYTLDGLIVRFITAPDSGVVISADYRFVCSVTIDYQTPVVAKDVNHVFDFSFTIQFGEWTP